MQFVYALLQGILTGAGVIIGMLMVAALFLSKIGGEDDEYDRKELTKAFNKYLKQLEEEERYEELEATRELISKLDDQELPDLSDFVISTKMSVYLEDKESGRTRVNTGKTYTVRKKTKETKKNV